MNAIEFDESLPTIRQLTSLLVREAMKRSRGNLDQAAEMVGLNRRSMLRHVIREFSRVSDR